MHAKLLLSASLLTLTSAQQTTQVQAPPPPPVLLTTTKSGVLPIIPTETPFTGLLTNEGAIIQRGPVRPGFTGPGGNATAQSGLSSAVYTATLPDSQFDPYTGTVISGTVTARSSSNSSGVVFTFDLSGFPDVATYGPFGYHIHDLPVPDDGNCTATLGHLDPTNRGELYLCDTANPQSCQAGDLAGKHGMIMATTFGASYAELYLSTTPGSPYFFGNRSIVFHTNNATRLTCANFVSSSSAGNTTATPTTGLPVPTEFPGAGARIGTQMAGIFGGFAVAAVFALML